MRAVIALATSLVLLSPVVAVAQDGASTTRIERRPVYGATVTEEQGVWVFRPIPPTRHMVIAPADGSPVNLSINQTEKTVRHYDDRRSYRAYRDYHDYRGR